MLPPLPDFEFWGKSSVGSKAAAYARAIWQTFGVTLAMDARDIADEIVGETQDFASSGRSLFVGPPAHQHSQFGPTSAQALVTPKVCQIARA
jgi:hypothetical protein